MHVCPCICVVVWGVKRGTRVGEREILKVTDDYKTKIYIFVNVVGCVVCCVTLLSLFPQGFSENKEKQTFFPVLAFCSWIYFYLDI